MADAARDDPDEHLTRPGFGHLAFGEGERRVGRGGYSREHGALVPSRFLPADVRLLGTNLVRAPRIRPMTGRARARFATVPA
ncbi:hypothetical protein GCM10010400_27530 [Streptomyces aculeolatus]